MASYEAQPAVLVAEDPNGMLVVGDAKAVAEFVARWQADGVVRGTVDLSGADRTAALSAAVDLGTLAAAAQYVRLVRPRAGGQRAVIREWVQGPNGQIISNRAINLLLQPNLVLVLGLIGVRAAIADFTQEITSLVEAVEDTVDDVLRLAKADRAGDVKGRYRVLRRRLAQLDAGAALSDTDWSTIASLGPDLEVGVERLRDYASQLVTELPAGARANERAAKLGWVVERGRLGEVLRLLVVAEQSLYMWQRLRIERVQRAEPGELEQAIIHAHEVLGEHRQADEELAEALRGKLEELGALRPSEFHRKLSGRRLHAHLSTLRVDLDDFAAARGLQAASWGPLSAPTLRDAVHVARAAAVESGRTLRSLGDKVVDSGLAGVGRAGSAVAAKAEQWRKEPSRGAGGEDEPPQTTFD